jgi:hypothetical protein
MIPGFGRRKNELHHDPRVTMTDAEELVGNLVKRLRDNRCEMYAPEALF